MTVPNTTSWKTRFKNGLLKADDFLEQNRRYLRPIFSVSYIVVLALALDYMFVFILSVYAVSSAIGPQNFQLVTGAISATAAAFSAYAAFGIRRGNIETRKTMVKPRVLVYGSTLEERQKMFIDQLPLSVTTIAKGGIWVENVGVGPAILATVYLIDPVKGRMPLTTSDGKYTFRRLDKGARIHLPSPYDPGLESLLPTPDLTQLGHGIRIQVTYFDINKVPYQLDADEEEVPLYVRRLEKPWKAAMDALPKPTPET